MISMRGLRRAMARAVLVAVAIGGVARADSGTPPPPEIRPIDAAGVLDAVRADASKVVLVNVWATWCQPCLEEMPDLLRPRKELAGDGLGLILVSGDFPDQHDEAVRFLGGLGVDFPSFIKDGDDMAFIDGLSPDWSGALPASFLFAGDGRLIDFWEGKRDYDKLRARLLRALGIEDKEDGS